MDPVVNQNNNNNNVVCNSKSKSEDDEANKEVEATSKTTINAKVV